MLFAILTAILAYRRAKETGRKGWVWAVAGACVFIGAQLLVGLAAGILIGFGVAFLNWPDSAFDDYEWPINIVAVLGAFAASWGLLHYLGRVPQEARMIQPPPPPTFEQQHEPEHRAE